MFVCTKKKKKHLLFHTLLMYLYRMKSKLETQFIGAIKEAETLKFINICFEIICVKMNALEDTVQFLLVVKNALKDTEASIE